MLNLRRARRGQVATTAGAAHTPTGVQDGPGCQTRSRSGRDEAALAHRNGAYAAGDRQRQLAALAESWEPAASATPPARRLSKCAACAKRMWFPWHFWLDAGGFKKELHVCNRCARKRGWA